MQSAYFVLCLPLSLPLLTAGPGTFFEAIVQAIRVSFPLAGMDWNDEMITDRWKMYLPCGDGTIQADQEQTLRLTLTTVVQSAVSSQALE